MANDAPRTTLDARYTEEDAKATSWPDAVNHLEQAGLFWVSTVRAGVHPYVTPVVGVWTDGALHFTCGRSAQKSLHPPDREKVVAFASDRVSYERTGHAVAAAPWDTDEPLEK